MEPIEIDFQNYVTGPLEMRQEMMHIELKTF